jgi:hypothetical protein
MGAVTAGHSTVYLSHTIGLHTEPSVPMVLGQNMTGTAFGKAVIFGRIATKSVLTDK